MVRYVGWLSSTYKRILLVILLFSAAVIFIKRLPKSNNARDINNLIRDSFTSRSSGSQVHNDIARYTSELETSEKKEIHFETEDEFLKRMSSRMKERRNRVKNACKKLGLPKKPFHKQALMEAKRYQLLYCRVPKAGSTNMDRVYGQLIKESDYPKIRNKMAEKNRTPHRVEYVTERQFDFEEIKKYLTLIVVRDPFVRLLSSFLMKVNNKGQKQNGVVNTTWSGPQDLPLNLSFADYVNHLLTHPGLFSILEKHWALYYDLCQPCHIRYDVIAHLETIEEDSRYFLSLIGAPRNITFIHGAGSDGKSRTKTDHFGKYYGTVKKSNLRTLGDLYRVDFELFGYSVPRDL